MTQPDHDLEAWVDESIRRSMASGYYPQEFMAMRARYGTAETMARLMRSGQIQSGLVKLRDLGMAEEWSVEAGILKFPDLFEPEARAVAKFRLEHIDDVGLR
jgi:hypothetical protein